MAERVVVSRTRRPERVDGKIFGFARQLPPELAGGWVGPDFLKNYRSQAWDAFENIAMPTTQDEAWRRTDLRSLQAGAFHLAEAAGQTLARLPKPPKYLLKSLAGASHGGQIVLTAAQTNVTLDPALAQQGVIFTDIASAQQQYPQILEKILGQIVPVNEGKFSALTGALAKTGVLVYVPRGVKVEQPLHSILWGPGLNLAYLTHLLVWVDDGASLTYVHEAASQTEAGGQSMHSGIVEIRVGNGANLRFVELQSWGSHIWNFSHERARVERDGTLDWVFGAIGSHLTKNFSEIDLAGQGATGRMSGFYFTDGDQHLDHDTQQNHLAPNTTSDLLFKGALRDESRSVWQGMIYVAPGAQKTDGYQANRNLVLSPHARADSIPGLEILADDVRCTHGATVGKIDQDQVFYLRSRGIPYREAERLIVEGFFEPIMQRIPFEGVRARFQDAIMKKMN
jgi:Fe-S cluster assembly protein SufD